MLGSPTKNRVPLSVLFPDQNVDDEERMDFIFAEFPLNPKLNEQLYSSKMILWESALHKYCEAVNSSLLSFNDVAAVKFNGKSSLALYDCWESQLKSRKLTKLWDLKRKFILFGSGTFHPTDASPQMSVG